MFSSMFECLNYIICKITMNNIYDYNKDDDDDTVYENLGYVNVMKR
jgi:hypothetical protein